jgi:uncharacterized C2H2 Zn-finger protein
MILMKNHHIYEGANSMECPNCDAMLKSKFMAAHLIDKHGYLAGSAAYAAEVVERQTAIDFKDPAAAGRRAAKANNE